MINSSPTSRDELTLIIAGCDDSSGYKVAIDAAKRIMEAVELHGVRFLRCEDVSSETLEDLEIGGSLFD